MRPESHDRSGPDRASKAAYMFANRVSPPESGTSCRCRMLPIGGSASFDTSECHNRPAYTFESASVWMRITPGKPSILAADGCTCASPNR